VRGKLQMMCTVVAVEAFRVGHPKSHPLQQQTAIGASHFRCSALDFEDPADAMEGDRIGMVVSHRRRPRRYGGQGSSCHAAWSSAAARAAPMTAQSRDVPHPLNLSARFRHIHSFFTFSDFSSYSPQVLRANAACKKCCKVIF